MHPIARCLHLPSFELQYEAFWDDATAGYEPRASVQAVVFAAWFSAAVAIDDNVANHEFGFPKANLVENMKIGTEVALSKANFLRTTKVETMQAFVMYMVSISLFLYSETFTAKLTTCRYPCAETKFLGLIQYLSAPQYGWQSVWA